jgi:hypothetical protein
MVLPHHISHQCSLYVPKRNLRSASKNLLVEPPARLKRYGERAFSVAAPKLWNVLPEALKSCDNVNGFKTALKKLICLSKHLMFRLDLDTVQMIKSP